MAFKHHFVQMALYNRWANARIYDVVSSMPEEAYRQDCGMFFTSIHGTLNHNIVGDLVWLHRITGEGLLPEALDQILYDTFSDLRKMRQEQDRRIIDVIDAFSEAKISGTLKYKDTKGIQMEKPYSWILGHFFNHQTHHRGQIHCALTQGGFEAPALDMTYFLDQTQKAA